MEGDFQHSSYSSDEERVVRYLAEIMPDIGGGDDPIGFLIASHSMMVDDRRSQVEHMKKDIDARPSETLVPPTCKQDVVDLLMRVQTGHVSCRKASDLLFPQFSRNVNV